MVSKHLRRQLRSGLRIGAVQSRGMVSSQPPAGQTALRMRNREIALENWAYRRGAQFDLTQPGKLTENAFLEAFNGRLRDECLNVKGFTSVKDAGTRIEAWRFDYNYHRPHNSIGQRMHVEFVLQHQTEAPKQVAIFS